LKKGAEGDLRRPFQKGKFVPLKKYYQVAEERFMPKLKAGDKAPDFKLEDQRGRKVKLSDFKGRKLLLYFYPKADTPG
jgi:peroxiredoxin